MNSLLFDRFDLCTAAVSRRWAFHGPQRQFDALSHSLKAILYGTLVLLNLWMLTAYAGGILSKNRKPHEMDHSRAR
jgi:hypothetical protein